MILQINEMNKILQISMKLNYQVFLVYIHILFFISNLRAQNNLNHNFATYDKNLVRFILF